MKILLKRIALKEEYTIGHMYIDGKYFCDVIEDKVRDKNKDGKFDFGEKKVDGATAIPYGCYVVRVSYSPKFRRMLPMLLDVPYFTGIRIHRGNTAKDSAGCLIVGENKEVGKVINSTKYEVELTEILKREDFVTIEIV